MDFAADMISETGVGGWIAYYRVEGGRYGRGAGAYLRESLSGAANPFVAEHNCIHYRFNYAFEKAAFRVLIPLDFLDHVTQAGDAGCPNAILIGQEFSRGIPPGNRAQDSLHEFVHPSSPESRTRNKF